MPKQKDHSREGYERAWQAIQLLKSDYFDACDKVRNVIPKTYARGLDRIYNALFDLEFELERRAERDSISFTEVVSLLR